ncbi:flavodoxin family protein [Candidatus Bathyarchaeota archaeon]|nr:flavodoxin family protein [Candidatus Bathyarchaeota archaeon]
MIYIVGIVGSPRFNGNTEILLSEALKAAAEDGAKTELIRLAGKEVKPCDACFSCRETGECRIKDDFKEVFEKMVKADGIIIATPVYFGSATPQIKALIDRAALISMARGDIFENKVGGPLIVARRAGQNFTLAQLLFFFLQQGMIIPSSTYWNIAFGTERGEVMRDEEGLRTARNFSKKMVWLIKKIKGLE